jgi:hypothetical protein
VWDQLLLLLPPMLPAGHPPCCALATPPHPQAHLVLRERLGPYITEARPNFKLLLGLTTAWVVYDERGQRYLDFADAEAALSPCDQRWQGQQQQQQPLPLAGSSGDVPLSAGHSRSDLGTGMQARPQQLQAWSQQVSRGAGSGLADAAAPPGNGGPGPGLEKAQAPDGSGAVLS